jgi:hypothetical protein
MTTERQEFAREFLAPKWPDEVIPWDTETRGLPTLSKPPPPCSGHPMRWVTRTVTYSPWRPVHAQVAAIEAERKGSR